MSDQDPRTGGDALVRIGELSRRTGVPVDSLRAWERRYGLLDPARSAGGFRLYGPADEARVRAMKGLIDSGVSAAEAARIAVAPTPAGDHPVAPAGDHADRLAAAFERFDETDANAILDDAFARFTVDAVVGRIVLPLMSRIGARWREGELSIAQEHFATGVLRGRMLSLARNWGSGTGPRALLACPPGEHHDLGLVAFGLVLRQRGWRVTYLGTDTPIETLAEAAAGLEPDAVVLAAVAAEPFTESARKIAGLGRRVPVLIGGAGVDQDLASRLGVRALEPDPIAAAAALSA